MGKLTEKQAAFVKAYYEPTSDTFGNGVQSAKIAGYAGNDNTLAQTAHLLLRNNKIIQAGEKYRQEIASKLDHNREIAIKALNADYDRLEDKANNGDIQAIQARTAIMRELSAISNLHSTTINKNDISDSPRPADAIDKSRQKLLKLKTG